MGENPNLYEFVVGTVGDPERMARATNEPQAYFEESVTAGLLSEDDRALLESGDTAAIEARMHEGSGTTRGGTKGQEPIWVLLAAPKAETE